MENTSALSRKTKAELIHAYEELAAKQKDLEEASTRTYGEVNTASLKKATTAFNVQSVQATVASLRTAATDAIGSFAKAFEAKVSRFEELHKAIVLAEERLKLVHELEVGADVAAHLVARFEEERVKLEREIATRKRDWEREQEEEKYLAGVARKRATDVASEEARRQEVMLKEREQAVAEREAALAVTEKNTVELTERIEQLPAEIDREAGKRITEAKKQWDIDFKRALTDKDSERDHLATLNDLEKKNIQNELLRVQTECTALRKEAELARRKAQELAIRIVESGTGEPHKTSAAPVSTEAPDKK